MQHDFHRTPGLRRWAAVAAVAAALACLISPAVACSSAGDDSATPGGMAGTGGTAVTPAAPTELVFESPSPVTTRPGENQVLRVRAIPEGTYLVRFALMGDAEDASLDRSEQLTSQQGEASVTLTAPSGSGSTATFTVRASVGTAVTAEVTVSVNEGGFAELQVVPDYTGIRPVTGWVASVHPGSDCAALPGGPAPDADLTAESDSGEIAPVISVPVGRVLAVTLRAGFFAGGCADVHELTAGELNRVEVSVTDVPLQLDMTDLEVVLGVDVQSATPTWEQVLEPLITQVVDAMVAGSDDDVDALLDTMWLSTASPAEAEAFAAARAAYSWDAALVAALGDQADRAIRNPVADWLSAGAQDLTHATIEGHLRAAGDSAGSAWLTLDRFLGVDASQEVDVSPEAHFVFVNLVSWNADPDDTVLLGAMLYFLPSRWLTRLAQDVAVSGRPSVSSAPEALALVLQCDALAATLIDAGPPGEAAYDGCNQQCAQALCETALAGLWQRGRDASATTPATLRISAVGAATVDEYARPSQFEGTWLGTLETFDTADPASLRGPARGSEPATSQ